MENESQEYRRLRRLIHSTARLQEDELWQEIEDFGKQCSQPRLYKSLKRKFWWHRKVRPDRFPLGHAPSQWSRQEEPLVSVIVPNYGHEPYLRERIDCILNQTFQNFELILLDDCSKDNSRSVLLSYKDHPRVSHIVLNEQNTGNTFLQWEKGVALARGRYVWIAESDDYADETFLDTAMAMFCLYPDSVLVRSGSYLVNEKGRVQPEDWDQWKAEDMTLCHYRGRHYVRHNLLHFNYVYNASMVVFRKDVFQQIDKGYQQLRYAGDWLCWIEMLMQGPMCEYRRKLNYFRQHQNKVSVRSQKANKGLFDQVHVVGYALRHVPMSSLCRLMLRGETYALARNNFKSDAEGWQAIRQLMQDEMGATRLHGVLYHIIRPLAFLPFIPTRKNDKL